MADFHAVVQLLPINRVAAGFERPVGALFRRGFGQPFQPRNFFVGHAQLTPVAQFHDELVADKANVLGADRLGCFSD